MNPFDNLIDALAFAPVPWTIRFHDQPESLDGMIGELRTGRTERVVTFSAEENGPPCIGMGRATTLGIIAAMNETLLTPGCIPHNLGFDPKNKFIKRDARFITVLSSYVDTELFKKQLTRPVGTYALDWKGWTHDDATHLPKPSRILPLY